VAARSDREPPRLSLALALPLRVWQAHLTPWLSVVEAARLRGVCKALRGVVGQCPVELNKVRGDQLKAALTCFPAAQSLKIMIDRRIRAAEEWEAVGLLRMHGGTLKRVVAKGEGARRLLDAAVRAGALPKLNYFHLHLSNLEHRQWLWNGRLRLVEQMTVVVRTWDDEKAFAALEQLRRLPKLQAIEVALPKDPLLATLPPFIPPSLKVLILTSLPAVPAGALLRDLPSMLQASGAGLQGLTIMLTRGDSIESGAALARVLQACSPTLKRLRISAGKTARRLDPAFASQVALGLLSCCERLERLHLPWTVFNSLRPNCPTFKRLTHLELMDDHGSRGGWVDFTSPVWDRVARGLLPALVDLDVRIVQAVWYGVGKGLRKGKRRDGHRLARALEGVAGTLRRLTLKSGILHEHLPAAVCHRLGVAIGKVQRLTYLSLDVPMDGRSYQAVEQGLVASGGCPPLLKLHLA
jgi:hypothetical protein